MRRKSARGQAQSKTLRDCASTGPRTRSGCGVRTDTAKSESPYVVCYKVCKGGVGALRELVR